MRASAQHFDGKETVKMCLKRELWSDPCIQRVCKKPAVGPMLAVHWGQVQQKAKNGSISGKFI